jgi:CRISPR-associated protein Csm3
MKQKELKKITGKIKVKTGLHIGAGNDKVEIGGMDNPVIRNPLTREPYIPGSSIKGKMRSLLEWKENKVKRSDGNPCKCGEPDCPICRIFGSGNSGNKGDQEKAKSRGPTRLIIRDAELTAEYKKKFKNGKPILEDKTENGLNRITALANPRHIERVVPDVEFNFELVYRVLDIDDNGEKDEELFKSVVLEGLRLLQNDYLGGGGSRGNGRIAFLDLMVTDGNGENSQKLEL